MKTIEKQMLLAKLIELLAIQGKEIYPLMGKPLSYFDFDKVKEAIANEELNCYGQEYTN
jgi:hypothetical protein